MNTGLRQMNKCLFSLTYGFLTINFVSPKDRESVTKLPLDSESTTP